MAAKPKVVEEINDLTEEETNVMHGTEGTHMTGERLGLFRRRAVAALVAKGVDRAKAIESVGQFGDGHILQWIITHGPEIAAFVTMIMKLFGL